MDTLAFGPSRRALPWLFLAGFSLFVLSGYFNYGLVAIDDYHDVTARIIPVGSHTSAEIMSVLGFRHPLPNFLLKGISEGVTSLFHLTTPVAQMRMTLATLGAFYFSVCFLIGLMFLRLYEIPQPRKEIIWAALFSFHFLSPFIGSRIMIESLSAPWIFASAYFACRYAKRNSIGSLCAAVLLLVVGSMLRLQAGVCWVAVAITVGLYGKRRDWSILLGISLLGFVLSGLLDTLWKGEFHGTLRSYIEHNMEHSSEYGVQPFWVHIGTLLGVTLPPTLFFRLNRSELKKEYAPFVPAVLYVGLFCLAHSLILHKEDRFMIPIFPMWLLLLVPLFERLFVPILRKARLAFFLALNIPLLVLASFSVAQSNVIGLAVYLDRHPEYEKVLSINTTLRALYPEAFIRRKVPMVELTGNEISPTSPCNEPLAVRQTDTVTLKSMEKDFAVVETFKPGPLEGLLVKLNPKNNARRAAIELLLPKRCMAE